MSWKHWTAIALVIGLGVLLQIPLGGDASQEHQRAEQTSEQASEQTSEPLVPGDPPAGPYRTIVLEVTGMT